MKAWFAHNRGLLEQRFPLLAAKMIGHFEALSTAAFALGVAEEFVIISGISLMALINPSWQLVWLGAFIAFTLHLVYHCLTALVLRRYTVSLATSLVFLPISCYLLAVFLQSHSVSLGLLILWSIAAIVIMLGNLLLLHLKLVPLFDNWLRRYQKA